MVPSPLKPLAKAIYHRLFRLHLRVRLWCADRVGMPVLDVPLPPAILRYRATESLSVPLFLKVGQGCANLVQRHVSGMGIDFANVRRVLDFGCGCGRTIRWFLRDCGDVEFHGVDADTDAVDWCDTHLRPGHFLAIAPDPPLPYAAEYFDVVYCISVFTHLNESMQDIWFTELRRVLKPGGVLLLTVYGKAAASELDAEEVSMLRSSGFVHKRSPKLKGLVPDWYQTSWHSREYILDRLSAGFEEVRYSVIPDGLQDVVVARKSGCG